MPLISTLISSLFITIVLIPWLMRHATRLHLVDQPNERKVHTYSVPRVGGIAMLAGILVPFLVWFPKDRLFSGILLGVGILAFFGVWDDRSDLNYRTKFVGQILASLAVVFVGDVYLVWYPFVVFPVDVWWIGYPVTVFCLLAIINAMNLSDGLDGLAAGASILSFGLVGVLAFQSGSFPVVILTLAVAGSILGFLRFNSHPARIFMGDTGSQLLGFMLGVLVIVMTQKVNPAMSAVLPLLIFGLPVIDTSTVMVRRVLAGRSPFSADKNHIHHNFMKIGFSHYETVVLLYLIQFGFVSIAYLLRFHVDMVVLFAFILYGLFVVLSINYLLKHDIVRRYNLNLTRHASQAIGPIIRLLKRASGPRVIELSLALMLLVYSIQSFSAGSVIESDIAILSLLIALLSFANINARIRMQWADAITMYTCCALLSYLGYIQDSPGALFRILDWVLVTTLGMFVLLSVMLSQRRFETSPLDFLVVLLAVLTPLLAAQIEGYGSFTLAVVKFVVLLYAFEYVRNGNTVLDITLVRICLAAGMLLVGLSSFND